MLLSGTGSIGSVGSWWSSIGQALQRLGLSCPLDRIEACEVRLSSSAVHQDELWSFGSCDDGGGKSFGKEIMLTVWDRHSVHFASCSTLKVLL
uniref:Uncharacterized protein n=1 Tax=Fagus sylvatica TaxID=28930 RepID=A0A2N9I879_FAGSY